jgi:adenosylmethionine-8-amino-7-oxononanoate aminotransferase
MNLVERDGRVIWHPYTQMKTADAPIAIARGEGALLFDEAGRSLIDAISSWWVCLHGHSHPHIAQKIQEQLARLDHVIFAGFTHAPAVELAERLLKRMPANHAKIFFSDDGSTAVEVGIKMAIQYWVNRGKERRRIVALENGYHGDTFGAMSASGRGAFVQPFAPFLFDVTHVPTPIPAHEKESLAALKSALRGGDVGAFVFEPLVQGAGGMLMYSPEALKDLLALCREHDVVTIADEVMTGFGRSGRFLATDHQDERPDIVCLSKGLTGGTLPMGATSCSEEVYQAFHSDDRRHTFFHGHSYTANPVGCAAAHGSLDLLERDGCWDDIRRIAARHQEQLEIFRHHPLVRDARQTGTILAVEIESANDTSYFNEIRDELYRFFLGRGVLLRPLGNVVYVLPPYCISNEQLETVYESLRDALEAFTPRQ